jgi:hypothetical protein
MRRPCPSFLAASCVLAALAALAACGTANTGDLNQDGLNVKSSDPMARPTQVAWTSARATHCGFIFSPQQLRANYLAAEAAAGRSQGQMRKITEAYDYTLESVMLEIKGKPGYCDKDRSAEIRKDLNRYLAGDYRATR